LGPGERQDRQQGDGTADGYSYPGTLAGNTNHWADKGTRFSLAPWSCPISRNGPGGCQLRKDVCGRLVCRGFTDNCRLSRWHRAKGNRGVWFTVHEDRSRRPFWDQLGNERNTWGATCQYYSREILTFNGRAIHSAKELDDNFIYLITNGVFELLAGEANLKLRSGKGYQDGGFGVSRKFFFGFNAVTSQLRQRWSGLCIGWTMAWDCAVGCMRHVIKDGVIKICATELIQVFAVAKEAERSIAVLLEYGCAKAGAKAADGYHASGCNVSFAREVGDGGRGFGHQCDLVKAHCC
jgi:hypothetical protein